MVNKGWCRNLKYGSEIDIREPILPQTETNGVPWNSKSSQSVGYGLANQMEPVLHKRTQKEGNPIFLKSPEPRGADKNIVVHYLGIAADEPVRLARLDGVSKISPLAAIGWTEADARKWCEENDLLSPIYTTATRGGCWFCHNQCLGQLRLLRKNYPDLWALLLKWDLDSPVSFHPDGHTVHDLDRRFQAEDEGKVPTDRKFRWKMLDEKEDNSD